MLEANLLELRNLLESVLPNIQLNPPVTEEQLHQAEDELGFMLPEDLRMLFLSYNGQHSPDPGLFFGLEFLSIEEMLRQWKSWTELLDEYGHEFDHYSVPIGSIKEQYINLKWLPIGHDGSGNHLGIDLDPGENGITGQIINFGRDQEFKYVIAESLTAFIQFIIQAIHSEDYTVHREDGFTWWNYGENEDNDFLYMLDTLKLPVLNPVQPEQMIPDSERWFLTLDEQWKARINELGSSIEMDFLQARSLRFIRTGLNDCSPIRHCKNLRELYLSVNEIVDIEPLAELKYLKKLYLANNPVCSLESLRHAEGLQTLNISSTKVSDLSPLISLNQLRELDISHSPVTDLSPLQSMTGLRTLKMSHLNDFDLPLELGQIAHLQSLTIKDSRLSNLDFLEECRSLTTLTLNNIAVEDITALAYLPSLEQLELLDSPDLSNLPLLAKSVTLQKITCSFEQFDILKDCFNRKIDFSSMNGPMTDEQSEVWLAYLR